MLHVASGSRWNWFNVLSLFFFNSSFRRKKKDDKMVDLTESWYLVYASGPMSKWR